MHRADVVVAWWRPLTGCAELLAHLTATPQRQTGPHHGDQFGAQDCAGPKTRARPRPTDELLSFVIGWLTRHATSEEAGCLLDQADRSVGVIMTMPGDRFAPEKGWSSDPPTGDIGAPVQPMWAPVAPEMGNPHRCG